MKIEEINIDGKSIGTIDASDKVFKVKPREDIIQLVIDWQQNKNFKKKGHTKSRGEVKGSRRKIVQQKGSGGARHGNITAPIFVGGGIAHGPRHRGKTALKKLNKKVRKLGLVHALSAKASKKQLVIFDEQKTKSIKKLNILRIFLKILIQIAHFLYIVKNTKDFIRSIKNIPNSKKIEDVGTNVYDLLKYEKILFTKESFKAVEERLVK